MNNRHRIFGLSCAAALVLTACGGQPTTVSPASDSGSVAETAATSEGQQATRDAAVTPQAVAEKLKFKREGQEAFSLKFKPDGGKLVDGADQELARFKQDDARTFRIKGPKDEALGHVLAQNGGWAIAGADKAQVFFVMRPETNGDYRLEDGNGEVLYRVQAREDGYKIDYPQTANTSEPMYKVKVKPGKVSLRDAAGETVLATKGEMRPVAMTAFAFDALSLEQQAALALALHSGG